MPHAAGTWRRGGAIRVAPADDSFLIREATQQVLARLARVNVIAVCGHGDEPLQAVEREHPAVVITDVRMPPSGDEEASGSRAPCSSLGHLTRREREVLAQMAEGKSNGAVADALVLTKRAVEKHVGAIFTCLELKDEEDGAAASWRSSGTSPTRTTSPPPDRRAPRRAGKHASRRHW